MKHPAVVLLKAALAAACLWAPQALARPAHARGFQFGVVGHVIQGNADEALLRHAIEQANQSGPAFVVATGIKAAGEACSDKLYGQRKAMLDGSERPMIVSLAGSDWGDCRNSAGRSNAIDRLNRLREVLFADGQSLGDRRIALTRLSSSAKFRSYAENAHWEMGNVLFATINLPARNNLYRKEAGRNSEFEDRMVANRAWLHRLFTLASRKKMEGVVLFSDGDVGVQVDEEFSLLSGFQSKKDGFAEPRKQIKALAEKFKGKVLLVDTQGAAANEPAIAWRGNLGHLSVAAEWAEVRVSPGTAALFDLKAGKAEAAPERTHERAQDRP
ncbi:hypothetical protein HSX11_21840 [Oxalobacteraceae bacterium]|nr:hypothetical protein [Oxalobacteraceae bacterium]